MKLRLVVPLLVVMAGCGDNRLRESPYLDARRASNDQAGESSVPGAGANNPSGGAGGWYGEEHNNVRPVAHIPTSDSTGMTGSGSGHGKGAAGAMTGEAARERR